MLCHLTTASERTVLLPATTFTFKLTQKTCQFSTSRSHFYPATSEEFKLPKQPSSKLRKAIFFNWLDTQKSPSKVVSLRRKSPQPDLCNTPLLPLLTSSYEPVPSTSPPATLPDPKHAGSSTIEEILQELNELDLPGRYLALDCEMVGVGINALRSSLARVSVVNYHGTVILDEYVKPQERVVDYRTRWSGIRASDLVNAKPFEKVQKTVIDLLDGRILIGHALHHDLKALLLSHPTEHTRDTQLYSYKFALCNFPNISLKKLVMQELGVNIQSGEHSSVEDARATMGIYRLHKNVWERANTTISQIQAPEPRDLWDLDAELDTTLKRRKLAKKLKIGIQTGERSSVKAKGVHRLFEHDGKRASGSISQIRGPKTKTTDFNPFLFMRREVAQQELGNDIQTGEHSRVVDVIATDMYHSQKKDRERASGTISQMRESKMKRLLDLILEKKTTTSKRRKVAKPKLARENLNGFSGVVSFVKEAAKGTFGKTSMRGLDGESREGRNRRNVTRSSGRKVIIRPIHYHHRRRDLNW